MPNGPLLAIDFGNGYDQCFGVGSHRAASLYNDSFLALDEIGGRRVMEPRDG
jgi:hypothetical protein